MNLSSLLQKNREPMGVEDAIKNLKAYRGDIRDEAAKALGMFRDPRAIEPLVLLLNDSYTPVRNSAACALQEYGIEYIEPIITSITKHHRYIIRANFRPKRPIDINVVENPPVSKSPQLKFVTVDLGQETISPLIHSLRTNKSLRDVATQVVLEFNTLATEPLLKELNNPDKDVRVEIINILGEIKDIRAIEPIMNALKDKNIDVRNAAAAAIKGFNLTTIPKERETIKEIVKIPCSYCGTLVDITSTNCPNCRAPLK